MTDHTEHAEPGFLPGIQHFKAQVSYERQGGYGPCGVIEYDIWAQTIDQAKDQAHEKAKKEGLCFDHILVTPVGH